jgi:hypothetical protein
MASNVSLEKENVIELKKYNFNNLYNKILTEDHQNSMFHCVRENTLMKFIRERTREAGL